MNVTKAQYVTNEGTNSSIKATIDSVELFVPLDPNNRHYIAIQEWVKKGNKIEDAD